MSKSIYEEALEELNDCKEGYSPKIVIIEQALEHAKKQEKLLNKIKEIIDRPHSYIASMLESSNRYYEIEKLIKGEIK